MRKYFLVCILLTIISGCSAPDKNAIPSDILAPNAMEAIIYDMHLAEGIIANQHVPFDSIAMKAQSYNQFIYTKHKTTAEVFCKSVDFYTQHPTILDSIYQGVIIKLTEYESRLTK